MSLRGNSDVPAAAHCAVRCIVFMLVCSTVATCAAAGSLAHEGWSRASADAGHMQHAHRTRQTGCCCHCVLGCSRLRPGLTWGSVHAHNYLVVSDDGRPCSVQGSSGWLGRGPRWTGSWQRRWSGTGLRKLSRKPRVTSGSLCGHASRPGRPTKRWGTALADSCLPHHSC